MGAPYLVTLSPKTYLRLKRTNEAKLLHCHKCGRTFQPGDEICFNCGSSRKRYDKSCFKGDLLVLGDNKPISEYFEGNYCFGRDGRESRVSNVIQREYAGNMNVLKASGLMPLEMTPEHPVLVVTGAPFKGYGNIVFSEPYWKPAKDVLPKHAKAAGDYLLSPILVGTNLTTDISLQKYIIKYSRKGMINRFNLNEATAWLLGLYAAEGSTHLAGPRRKPERMQVQIELTLGQKDITRGILAHAIDVVKTIGAPYGIKNNNGHPCLVIYSTPLGRALKDWIGQGSDNKKVPDFIMTHVDNTIVSAFVDGYLRGDGNFTHHWTAATTSKVLALQVQMLSIRIGMFAALSGPHASHGFSDVNNKTGLPQYWLCFGNGSKNVHNRRKWLDDFVLSPVTSNALSYFDGRVYNLETESQSYLASNTIVHNCAAQVNFEVDPPPNYEEQRKAVLAEVEAWKKEQKKAQKEEKKSKEAVKK